MLVEVSSRPGSIRSAYMSDEEDNDDESEEEEEEEEDEDEDVPANDTRSIRSFESMMAETGKRRRPVKRKTLSDRLASMPGLSKFSGSQAIAVSPVPLGMRVIA